MLDSWGERMGTMLNEMDEMNEAVPGEFARWARSCSASHHSKARHGQQILARSHAPFRTLIIRHRCLVPEQSPLPRPWRDRPQHLNFCRRINAIYDRNWAFRSLKTMFSNREGLLTADYHYLK